MSDRLSRNKTRVRENRAARQAALDKTPANLPTRATRVGAPYLPGESVFDVVSGQDGTVTACSRAAGPGALSVCLELEDGTHVVRRAEDLIGRPTAAPSESGK